MAVLNFASWEMGAPEESRTQGGTANVSSVQAHSPGTYSLRVNPTTTGSGSHRLSKHGAGGANTSDFNVATLYQRFYFRVATAPSTLSEEIISIIDATGSVDKCYLRLDSARKLSFYDNTVTIVAGSLSTTVLSLDTWYRIELKTTTGASTTAYEYRIFLGDSTTALETVSGSAAQGTSNNGSVRLGKVTNRNGKTVDFYYDDWLADDANWPGPGACLRLAPTANGSTAQWTSGTNASNYLEVDDFVTMDTTTYIKSNGSAAQTHLVALQDCATVGVSGTINAVKAFAFLRLDSTGTTATSVTMKSGGTTNNTGTNALTTTLNDFWNFQPTDPNTGAAWTTAAVDALEIGVTEANAVASRCSVLSALVDFTVVTGNVCNLPTGAVVATAGAAPTTRVKESTALPTGAHVTAVGAAPTARVSLSAGLPTGAVVGVVGAAPTVRVKESTALPAGAHVTAVGAAPAFVTPNNTGLPSGVVAVAGDALTARVSLSTGFPSGAVVEVEGHAPTFAVSTSDPALNDSFLPDGAAVDVTGGVPAFRLVESSAIPAGLVAVAGHAPSLRISESVSLAAGLVAVAGAAPLFNRSETAALPTGAVVALQGEAPGFTVDTVSAGQICNLPAGAVVIAAAALGAVRTSPDIPVTDVHPGGSSGAGYDAILWPQQWAQPVLTLSLLPTGEVKVRGQRPKAAVTTRQFSRLPSVQFRVAAPAEAVRFLGTENNLVRITPAKISTKALPPAILVQERAIFEDELICLLTML